MKSNISSRQLTWRDVQHLTVLTAKRNQLFDPSKTHLWHINGAGLEFNHLFGFGVLDGKKTSVILLLPFSFHSNSW